MGISFGVIFGALLLVGIAFTYLNCFIKNPYTGLKVYVGCWCCKKNIDFEEDYKKQMGGLEKETEESRKDMMQAH